MPFFRCIRRSIFRLARPLLVLTMVIALSSPVFSQWERFYPFAGNIGDVAVAEPGYVYLTSNAGNGNGFIIMKSTDGARTWKRLSAPSEAQRVIWFTDSITGYMPAFRGVYKTVDGARSWNLVATPADLSGGPANIFFATPTTGYLTDTQGRMARTTDAGATWTLLPQAPKVDDDYYGLTISMTADHAGYVVSEGRVYKTLNDGDSWTLLPTDMAISAVCAVNASVAYVSNSGDTFRTTDGGETWQNLYSWNTALMHDNGQELLLFMNYGEIVHAPRGSNDFTSLYHSDIVMSWYQLSFAGDFGCVVAGDDAILTTTDGGHTWKLNQVRPQHGQFRDVHFFSDNKGLMIQDSKGIVRTDDNGASWYYAEGVMERSDIYQMAFTDSDTGIFVVTNNFAYTTYDGGASMFMNDWSPPIVGHMSSSDYEMIDSKVLYTVGRTPAVLKSIDGGKSWTPHAFDFGNSLSVIKCLDANTCHAAGLVGMVVSTWDGGAHWKVHNLNVNNDLSSMHLVDASLGFIGGKNGTILRTTDGGQTWTQQESGAGWPVISFHFIAPGKGYAVTSGAEVLRTDDNGAHWKQIGEAGANTGFYDLATSFMRDTTYIYGVSNYNVFRWKLPPPKPGPDVTSTENEDGIPAVVVFPNPTDGPLHIVAAEPVSKVTLLDMKGAVLQQTHGSEIDMAALRPGMYLVQTVFRSRRYVHKVIKQ